MFGLYDQYYGKAILHLIRSGLYGLHSRIAVMAGWPSLERRGLVPLIMASVTTLESVVNDFNVMIPCGHDNTGHFLAGQLAEEAGTYRIVATLIKLVNDAPTYEHLPEYLKQYLDRWMRYRYRHSARLNAEIRTEVDRLVRLLVKCDLPVLHYLDVRDSVSRSITGTNELDLIAIAIQACGEAGYEAVGDKWIREITVQLSSEARGILLTPTPTPRGVMLGILGRMFVVHGVSIHGLPTGDRWFAETEEEYCTDSHSRLSLLSEFRASGRHMIRQPVLKSSIRDVPRWMSQFLHQLVLGEHKTVVKSFKEYQIIKNSDVSPSGPESAVVYELFLTRLAKAEGGASRAGMVEKVVSMRSLVGMASASETPQEFCRMLAERIIGTFEIARLKIRGQTWDMTIDTDEVGQITTDASGSEIPSDLVDFILKTIRSMQGPENTDPVPCGGSMVYLWPIARVDIGAYSSWRKTSEAIDEDSSD
ncbi:unnamed protein product [Agarophyton chilense]